MDPQFIEYLVGASGTAGVAALALWMLNKTWEQRLAETCSYAATLDKHRLTLVQIATDAAKAQTEMAESLDKMSQTQREMTQMLERVLDAVAPRSQNHVAQGGRKK